MKPPSQRKRESKVVRQAEYHVQGRLVRFVCVCGVTILYRPSCPSGPNNFFNRIYIERQDLMQGGPCIFFFIFFSQERGRTFSA